MMGFVGGREPFDDGRNSLKELAGIELSAKAVERTAEAIGEEIEQITRHEGSSKVGCGGPSEAPMPSSGSDAVC
jgi:hypothetical protein